MNEMNCHFVSITIVLCLLYVITCSSSGAPCFELSDDINACRILFRCFVSASPATDDKKDNALVFIGGDVNCQCEGT